MKALHLFALAAVAATTPIAASAADKAAVAPIAIPAPPAGQGQILVYRPGKFSGSGMRCTVREDGKMIGRAGNGKYFLLTVPPGAHHLTAKSEKTDTLNVEVEADETSFVKCTIAMGVMVGRPNLSPGTEADFQSLAAKIKLADAEEMAKEIAKDDAERASKPASAGASSN